MGKIKKILIDTIKHDLISGSFYVLVGTTASSFLSFILNIYFARNLSYSDYGTFASLISLVTLLTIPAASLSAIVVRYATQFFSKNENEKAGAFYLKVFKYLLFFNLALNIVVIVLSPIILSFLKISEISLIILVGISATVFYLATLNVAFIQSTLRFRLLGSLYLIAAVGKLIGGIVLITLGFRVYGALMAVIIFSAIDFILGFLPLRKVILIANKKVDIGRSDIISYAVPTSIAIFSLSSFISTDVLLVKHFFNSSDAGFYGGLSLIGKVIFYFTGPIPVAMFPLIIRRHTKKENYKNLFYISMILVLIPSIAISVFYFIFSDFTVKLFLGGGEYLSVAPFLGLFGVFLTIFSINNVFVNFFLSIKKTKIWMPVLVFAILQIFFIYLFHKDFHQIIWVSIVTSLLLLASLMLYYLKINAGNFSKKNN